MSEADLDAELGRTYFELDSVKIQNKRLTDEVEQLKLDAKANAEKYANRKKEMQRMAIYQNEYVAEKKALTARNAELTVALTDLLDTIGGATSADLHHHQCPKYARFGNAEYICNCGADAAEEKARAVLEAVKP